MARPAKSPAEKRTEQLNIALSPKERAKLQTRAAKANMTLTDFARAAALNRSLKVVESTAPDFMTRHELRRIGNNINQAVHLMHIGKGGATAVDLIPYLDQLDQLFALWLADGSTSRKSWA